MFDLAKLDRQLEKTYAEYGVLLSLRPCYNMNITAAISQ